MTKERRVRMTINDDGRSVISTEGRNLARAVETTMEDRFLTFVRNDRGFHFAGMPQYDIHQGLQRFHSGGMSQNVISNAERNLARAVEMAMEDRFLTFVRNDRERYFAGVPQNVILQRGPKVSFRPKGEITRARSGCLRPNT